MIFASKNGRLSKDFFSFFRRTKSGLQQGVVDILSSPINSRIYRNSKLELLDQYYESTQYNHLMDWFSCDAQSDHIPVRQRRPFIKANFTKVLSQRITAKLIGKKTFPKTSIEDNPLDEEFFKAVLKASKLRANLIEPTKRLLAQGSVFVRFYMDNGRLKVTHHNSKHSYPEWAEDGELEKVIIKYVYEDHKDIDSKGKPKKKWYKAEYNRSSDILYDNPEYKEEDTEEPVFQVVEQVEHGLGFVQGEWFKTCDIPGKEDGYSLVEDILEFIDEINYSICQSSVASNYNQDPQLIFSGMDEEDLEGLIRSSQKAWHLGKEGEAKLLEAGLSGVEAAGNLRDKMQKHIGEFARIVFMDPEKIVGHAQSAKALEILHGPMLDLLDEIRPFYEEHLKKLIIKVAILILIQSQRGEQTPITLPRGYAPQAFDFEFEWPPVFQQTIQDMQQKVNMVAAATNASLIARETGTKYIAEDFGVEDVELELEKIANQPVINPFGMF